MKKVLKFAGIISAVLALVAFILLMATPVASYKDGNLTGYYEGMNAIFGTGKQNLASGGVSLTGDFDGKLAWSGLLAWIFVLLALLILIAGIVLPLLKVKAMDKFAGLLNLIAVGLLIVAGVFAFISRAVFWSVNEFSSNDGWSLGAGWIIGGILLVLAGLVAIAPAAIDFIGKKK